MRRFVLSLLLVVVAAVTTADRVWCPDGCLDSENVATSHASETPNTCVLCANGVQPGPQLSPIVVAELVGNAAAVPPQRLPMTPPRTIDHPPA